LEIFIGIDDTDNLTTRGTGHHARMLGHSLVEAGLFEMHTVTRHQLLVNPAIPYTSHNSSACLAGNCPGSISGLIAHAKDFLIRVSAFDSDAGLCVAAADDVSPAIIDYGERAKREILRVEDAFEMIRNKSVYLEGFLNKRIGVIGALAAVGLRAGRNDGRLLWSRNLRETTGDFLVSELLSIIDIERITEKDLRPISSSANIRITEWCRPVMIGGEITLIAEKTENNQPYAYQSASKDYIKSISE
jgi:hypothetical protein